MAGSGFKISFDTSALEKKLEKLAGSGEKGAEIARKVAASGAKVYYQHMVRVVPVSLGTLRDSIYHFWDKPLSSNQYAIYHIGPNMKKAPHWHLVEYGHQNTLTGRFTPPKSYIRSTLAACKQSAYKEACKAYARLVKEVMDGD